MAKRIRRMIMAVAIMMLVMIIVPANVNAISETGTGHDSVELTEGVWESTVYVTESNGRNVRAHIIKVNNGANVSFKASTPNYYKKNSTKKSRTKLAKKWKTGNWGYATVAKQAIAYSKAKDKAGTVIAGINGDFYDPNKHGKTAGKLILEGNKLNKSTKEPFFAVLKDGTYDIREGNGSTKNVVEAIAGRYRIMENGKPIGGSNNDTDTITAIGITADNDVILAVVDGREPTSVGTCAYDVAKILQLQGCVEAIQLDCGGSSTFLTRRPGNKSLVLRNTPNDGYVRPVSSALLLVKNKKSGSAPVTNTAAGSMEDPNTLLKETDGVLSYIINGKKQSGFFSINNTQYLFDSNGDGATETVKLGKTSYSFVNGKLAGCSDSKAGKIAIGYCGADNGGKNLVYAYQFGNKKLNIGLNPYVSNNSGKMRDWADIIDVPWQTEKLRVKTVVVGEGVVNIGNNFLRISRLPFNQLIRNKKPSLTSVTLPSSLTKIGKDAFFNHSKLKKITIPEKVSTIKSGAFSYDEKTVFTFKGKTHPTVGSNAFKTSGSSAKWKVKKTKSWKSFAKASKKKKGGFKGKISYY